MSGVRMHAALFKRLIKIHSSPPILYYGFNEMILFRMTLLALL